MLLVIKILHSVFFFSYALWFQSRNIIKTQLHLISRNYFLWLLESLLLLCKIILWGLQQSFVIWSVTSAGSIILKVLHGSSFPEQCPVPCKVAVFSIRLLNKLFDWPFILGLNTLSFPPRSHFSSKKLPFAHVSRNNIWNLIEVSLIAHKVHFWCSQVNNRI